MAYIFAKYATEFCDLGPQSRLIYALLGIIVLTFINAIGVRPGRIVQNALTTANIVGLTGIAIIGLVWWVFRLGVPAPVQQAADNVPQSVELSFALTMVLVFYAYGGWNEAAFIAAEVKNPRRNVRRALVLGTLLVTVIYLCVNLAYLGALGYDGVCRSKTIAADMFELPFGVAGRKIISALIMFSSLGSIHGLLFTGMRLYGTFGRDHPVFAWLAGKGDSNHSHGALFAQAIFSIILIAVVELAIHWRQAMSTLAGSIGWRVDFDLGSGSENIYKLVACTAPVFWLFFLLTGCSLFVLRWREPNRERPYRVPLYPILPLIFVLSCAFMLYKSTAYALEQEPAEAIIVAGLMFGGLPLGLLSSLSKRIEATEM
jgi:amino acid transporter